MDRLAAISLALLLSVGSSTAQLGGSCHQPHVQVRWDVGAGFPSTVIGVHADVQGDDCEGAAVAVAVAGSRGSALVDGDGYAYVELTDPVAASAVTQIAVVVTGPMR